MRRTLLLIILALSLPAQAVAEAPSLYYILDGSGSMWGRVDGRIKMQVAKEVLSDLLQKTPKEYSVALAAYGHRKKGDCSDIEELVPLAPINASTAIEKVRSLSPRGKTPISDALKFAAAKVGSLDAPATIVLVSDGIETCDADPCETAKALRASGAQLVVHVIGFDIQQNDRASLACIAESAGGQYFSADDADSFVAALQSVQKIVTEKQNPPVADAPATAPNPNVVQDLTPEPEKIIQPVVTASKSIRIKASGPGRIAFRHDQWLKRPNYWKLLDPETGEERGRFSGLETTLVQPGEYQLAWDQYEHGGQEIRLGEVVRVDSGKTAEIPLLTAIKLNLPDWAKKPYYWSLVDPQNGETVAQFNVFEPVLVPSGDYQLVWRQLQHGSKETPLQVVHIEADKLNIVDLKTAINPAPAEWLQKRIEYWGLRPVDSTSTELVAYWRPLEPQFVAAGKYRLVYQLDEHRMSESELGIIEVLPDQLNSVAFNTGVKLNPQPEMAEPYRVLFQELDEAGKQIAEVRLFGSFGPIMLKAGTYRVVYHQKQHGSSPQTIVESFELPTGSLVEIDL